MDLKEIQSNMNKVILPGGDPQGIYIYKPETDLHSTILYSDGISPQFFDSQNKFLQTLTEEERNILASYSFVGDEVINKISNTMKDVRKLKKDSWRSRKGPENNKSKH